MLRAVVYGFAIAVALSASAAYARHATQARRGLSCPCGSKWCATGPGRCSSCCDPFPCIWDAPGACAHPAPRR